MISLLAALLLCLLAGGASGETTLPPADDEWIRVTTPHFSIVSNARQGASKEIALQLERFRALVEGEGSVSSRPSTIVIFRDEVSYWPYKMNRQGKPANVAGHFASTRDGNYIGVNADAGETPYSVIFHEYTHYLLNQTFAQIPLWMNEGRAEFFSTVRMRGDRAEVGRPVEHHVRLLRQRKMLPLDQVFLMTTKSPGYNEGTRQGLFYAQSWVLYHYLMMNSAEQRRRLPFFLRRMEEGDVPTETLFESTYGYDFEQLEKKLKLYVQANMFNFLEYRDRDLGSVESQVQPMTRADYLHELGDYLAHVTPWRAEDAAAHFRESLRLDPKQARSHASLARLLEDEGKMLEANEHYAAAIENAGEDYFPFFAYGMSSVDRFLARKPKIFARPKQIPKEALAARGLLARSLSLSPGLAEAHYALGITFLFDPNGIAPAIEAFETAREMMPTRMDVVYYEVLACLQAGDRKSATALIEQVLEPSGEKNWVQPARQALSSFR